jgi:hypothetical protein
MFLHQAFYFLRELREDDGCRELNLRRELCSGLTQRHLLFLTCESATGSTIQQEYPIFDTSKNKSLIPFEINSSCSLEVETLQVSSFQEMVFVYDFLTRKNNFESLCRSCWGETRQRRTTFLCLCSDPTDFTYFFRLWT